MIPFIHIPRIKILTSNETRNLIGGIVNLRKQWTLNWDEWNVSRQICISSHIARGFEINNETPISKSSHIVRGFERTLFISRLVGWGLIAQVLGANSPETGG